MTIDGASLEFILTVVAVVGVMFSIYLHFRNPQIKTDQIAIKLREDVDTLTKAITEVKEKHLHAVEQDMKRLTDTINQLSLTVTKLSTVIDERIPKK
jgi:hypothetical protein